MIPRGITLMRAFLTLIDRLTRASDEQRPQIEQLIWDTFGVEKAVLTLDMSNFSLTVRRAGILSYLCKIHLMRKTCEPIVSLHGGEVVKQEADNLLCVFESADDAVHAAIAFNTELHKQSRELPSGESIRVSVGIGWGRFLLIPGTDCYGDAVNKAFVLGEDLAEAGEILITGDVMERLPRPPVFELQAAEYSISGMAMAAFRVVYR